MQNSQNFAPFILQPPFATMNISQTCASGCEIVTTAATTSQHPQKNSIMSPIPDPQSTTHTPSPNITPSTPTSATKAPVPYHPSADLNLDDDSDEEEIMQPPTHERVRVTKAASVVSKITTQLNKAKQEKFDASMDVLQASIAKLVTAIANEHSYKDQYVTKPLNHTANYKSLRLLNLKNAKVNMKTVEINAGK